jgi:hypothetical protein
MQAAIGRKPIFDVIRAGICHDQDLYCPTGGAPRCLEEADGSGEQRPPIMGADEDGEFHA